MNNLLLFPLLLLQCNHEFQLQSAEPVYGDTISSKSKITEWRSFLQNLPVKNGPVVDFRGRHIPDQSKHFQLIDYDTGDRDLQQCADFLIRLRAEYLFSNGRSGDIVFRFTDGRSFSFNDYCKGLQPVLVKGDLKFRNGNKKNVNYGSLRNYLEHVFSYAGTMSLLRDLKPADGFSIGTVIITPGSPGHCMVIVDEKIIDGEVRYKLAESFMPAQTPYILKNPEDGTPWYALKKGKAIETSSFLFTKYSLRRFE